MITYLFAALILASTIIEPVRPLDRLDDAGYTNEVASLLEALHDGSAGVCGDAVYHLRNKIDEAACPTLSEALSDAMARADVSCVVWTLRLHMEICVDEELLDQVYRFSKDAYLGHELSTSRSLAYQILAHLHREKGYDIFKESLDTALHARSWHTRHGALRILVDSYSHRLCPKDAERIYARYPEDIGQSFVLTLSLQQMRERIDNTTFGCERTEEERPRLDQR